MSGPGYTRLASAKPLGPLSMLVNDSGRLPATRGEGVPGMRPGLLYVIVMPSPDDCSLKPPNVTAPLPVSLGPVCALALAPMPARNATPTSAASARLRRRICDLWQ